MDRLLRKPRNTPWMKLKRKLFTGLPANPAEFLGVADRSGSIATGKRADLILLISNPLENVSSAARRERVMVRGLWLSEAELRKMLDEMADSYSKED